MGLPAHRQIGAGLASSGEGEALTAADLAARVDELLAAARARGRAVTLHALEDLYTTGCAQVLELEAEAVRLQRRSKAVLNGTAFEQLPHSEIRALTSSASEVEQNLNELRAQIRHLRTAAEWLREGREQAGALPPSGLSGERRGSSAMP